MIFSWGTFFLLLVVFGLFLGSLSAAVARRALGGAEFFSLRPHPLGSILGILLVLWLFFHALVEVSALHGTPLVEYILYNTPLDFLRLWPSWWKGALGGILLAGVTTTVTLTDLWEMRIPFRLSGYALLATYAYRVAADPSSFPAALLGSLAFSLAFFLVYLVSRGGLGFGDVVFAAVLGGFFAPGGILPVILLASLMGLLYALPLLAMGKRTRKDPIPFGPFLAAAWVWFLYGNDFLERLMGS